jgi:exonuclease SbcC
MPLEKLRIRGFQAHADLTVNLDPKITTIQGPTDSGKSAILRALKWLATNRPAGDAFRRAGGKFTAVDLRVDGKVISRRKGKKNIYKLDGQVFAAMGNRVPDEIAALLNIGDTNFAGQFDAPFWLADSPGAVSRNLNAIVDLGIIDETLSAVGARLRKAGAAVEVTRERLAAARAERAELAWVPAFVDKLGKLERQAAEIESKRQDCRTLTSLIGDAESAVDTARNAVAGLSVGRAAVAVGERWAAAVRGAAKLRGLIQDVFESQENSTVATETAGQARLKFEQQTKGQKCPLCGNLIR